MSQFFEVKEEAFVDALSASNGRSMMQIQETRARHQRQRFA